MAVLGRWLALVMAVGVIAAACGSGAAPDPTSTATSRPPTPTSTPVAIPERPAAIEDYALTAAPYLSAAPQAAENCLGDLFGAWDMPMLAGDSWCQRGNADDDADDELAVVFSTESAEPTAFSGVEFRIAIFDPAADGFSVAYESPTTPAAPPGVQTLEPILTVGDIFGTGAGGVAYKTETCGAHTCSTSVHVVRGTDSSYSVVTPPEGLSLETATVSVEDTNGDGVSEIVMTGGQIGSVGAGPQREETRTWSWNGSGYEVSSVEKAPPTYLYHAIKDADALFSQAEYAAARDAYLAAVGDDSLKEWMPDRNERQELDAYALFRAGLSELMATGDAATANGYFDQAESYQSTLNSQLAGAFQAAYEAKGELSAACSAVRDDILANLAEYQAFWDFGYANPEFDPASVCPF